MKKSVESQADPILTAPAHTLEGTRATPKGCNCILLAVQTITQQAGEQRPSTASCTHQNCQVTISALPEKWRKLGIAHDSGIVPVKRLWRTKEKARPPHAYRSTWVERGGMGAQEETLYMTRVKLE